VLLAVALAAACGGTVDNGTTAVSRPEDPPIATGGAPTVSDGGSGGVVQGSGGAQSTDPDLPDARYVDPGCKPTDKIEGVRECDAKLQTGCTFGERCVPYVTYGERCSAEIVGTRCEIAGTATQGQDCGSDLCAAGYVCVTCGAGFVCAQLCTTNGPEDDCPRGLLCSPLDVDGFSVCS